MVSPHALPSADASPALQAPTAPRHRTRPVTARMPANYHLPHLRTLEAEAIHVMREPVAEFERPVLLFSGGKGSIVLLRLPQKAFRPPPFPIPCMDMVTRHNIPRSSTLRHLRNVEPG